ncbi:MAG: SMI1/KNR4 family protein [Inhella sp.]
MAIDTRAFWGNNYYQHPELTDAMVAAAEATLGVRLPAELVTLLKIQNGGYTKGFVFPIGLPTSWAADHVPLDDLAGIVTDPAHRTAQNLLDTAYMTQEWGLPPKQVLLSGNGAYWITLDYRSGPMPSIAWIDVDCEEDLQIAPSFAHFLDGLIPSDRFKAG